MGKVTPVLRVSLKFSKCSDNFGQPKTVFTYRMRHDSLKNAWYLVFIWRHLIPFNSTGPSDGDMDL